LFSRLNVVPAALFLAILNKNQVVFDRGLAKGATASAEPLG
jgi:hypothetical protein